MNFTSKIVNWYIKNKRSLPWRSNKEPYLVWLSEIILQQTKIKQGLPYFIKFKTSYPTIFDLAKANEQDILKLWEGLGYYSRARNLHKTAIFIAENYNGVFPSNSLGLIKLPGIGKYTASAIASICFNEKTAVVDGNVFRVLSRYFGINTPINSSTGIKEFDELAKRLLPKNNFGDYNQALMDFGSLICKPKLALCSSCTLNKTCWSNQNDKIHLLPVKVNKLKVKNKYLNFLIINFKGSKTLIQKRNQKGKWANMYQFPLLETSNEINKEEIVKSKVFDQYLNADLSNFRLINDEHIIHKLSHQKLFIKFWEVKSKISSSNYISIEELNKYPFPIVLNRFINSYFCK